MSRGRPSPHALIPGGVSLAAVCTVPGLHTAGGRPALCLAAFTTGHRVTVAHIPHGATWALDKPAQLPSARDEREGLTLAALGGARLTLEHGGRRAVLDIPTVRLLGEVAAALGVYDGHRVAM